VKANADARTAPAKTDADARAAPVRADADARAALAKTDADARPAPVKTDADAETAVVRTGVATAGGAPGAIDVAIVAYRNWKLTRSCLEHLRRQTVAHRVIVCDNGCDQDTSRRLAEQYPEVTVVRMERNMTYPVACNVAVAAGEREIVVMMNNDIDARPDFLERLAAPFATRPDLGSVAALLLRPGEQQIDSAGLTADRTLAAFPRLKGRPPEEAQGQTPLLAGPDGAAAAFRRTAWDGVGGMDESIPGYMDDFDLALRLRAAGWGTLLACDAVAVHLGSATYGHRSVEQRRKAGFGRAYLLRRYGVLHSRAALRALVTELIVLAGDFALSRDIAALIGRRSGWRAAGPRLSAWPPADAIDERIGFRDSMRLRRNIYMRPRTVAISNRPAFGASPSSTLADRSRIGDTGAKAADGNIEDGPMIRA
jgi:N-acetylglucosaminyl-diphospho-decaprenol L-rhamnosyltransferase